MKSFKELSEQHAEEGRFKPVKPQNVSSKPLTSPRDNSDSANVKLKEDFDVCQHCQSDPCICDDSHGFVTETKRMSAAVKLQRAFEREQSKSAASRSRMATDKEQDAAFDKLKAHMSKPETMGVLKRLKNEAYNDYHNNRTGFAKRQREDDEYHTPDPTTRTHTVGFHVSKDGEEKHHRTVTINHSTKTPEEAKAMARAHLEKKGYTIHEEVELDESAKKAQEKPNSKPPASRKTNPLLNRPWVPASKRLAKEEVELDEAMIGDWTRLKNKNGKTIYVKSNTNSKKRHTFDVHLDKNSAPIEKNKLSKTLIKTRHDAGEFDKHFKEEVVLEAGNKPLEPHVGMGDSRTPRELKTQMSGASTEFVKSTAAKKPGVFHSKVSHMQNKLAKSELRKRTNEEVEELDEAMSPAKQGIVAAGGGTPADQGMHAASQEKPPFDGPYKKKSSATPGKYGSGYSTARHLARQAMSKFSKPVKEESEYSRKAQIVKNAKKSKKTDDKFEPEPELGTSVVKADN